MSSVNIHTPTWSEEPAPNEGWATGGFDRGGPIDVEMQADLFPWESPTPMTGFVLSESAVAAPAPVVIGPSQRRVAERYVRHVAAQLPDDVRESFERGAGMFEAPPTADDGLDGLFE
jgi:hypothetical protein